MGGKPNRAGPANDRRANLRVLRAAPAARKAVHGRRVLKVLFRAIAMRVVALHGGRRRIGRRVATGIRLHRGGLRGSVLSARHASSTANAPNAHRAASQQVTVASGRLVAKVPVAPRAVLRETAHRGALKASGPHVLAAMKALAARPLTHRVARVAQTTPAAPPPRALAAASIPARVESAPDATNAKRRANAAHLSARALAPAAAVPTNATRSTGRRATKVHAGARLAAAMPARLQVSAVRPGAASARSPRQSSVRTEIAPNARRARIVEHEHLPHAGSAIGRHAQNIRSVRRAPANPRAPSAVKDPLRPRPPRIAAIATMPPARYGCRS